MLKGHTFDLQTFTSAAFALFIDKFLNSKSGVATGCTLSNTNTSVTISGGYFVIRGRFLQIISGETINGINNDGYYRLICEIDLTKTNTKDQLNQAEIKLLYGANALPSITKQNITTTGTLYQYEFARFRKTDGNIVDFEDKRTFVDFTSIRTVIENESQALLNQIEQELNNVINGSVYLLKSGGTATGDFNFNGITTLGGKLNANGETVFGGVVTANKDCTFKGKVSVTGASTFASTVNISGITTLGGKLNANGETVFGGVVTANKDCLFKGKTTFNGNAAFAGSVTADTIVNSKRSKSVIYG